MQQQIGASKPSANSSEAVDISAKAPEILCGKVGYDFTASAPDQLGLKKGQIVQIIEAGPKGAWSKGLDTNTGKSGYFPTDYVQVLFIILF